MKRGDVMTTEHIEKSSRKRRDASREEPPYVHTSPYDGRKYIDSDEFVKLPHVQRQMEQLDELIKKQRGA